MTGSQNKVTIVICSTRTPSVGDKVADFVKVVLDEQDTSRSPALSLYFPAMVPAKTQVTHEHSKTWSANISKFSGYIFVTPRLHCQLRHSRSLLESDALKQSSMLPGWGVLVGCTKASWSTYAKQSILSEYDELKEKLIAVDSS
ncbi:uncharacterized protein V1513DRAFT_481458 [Lipomyces chichibuensis]|uniref:uncharacterized protein n=1 Tax=Lipomyces chichibuensis TaxID=1546026 RepID=UPI0033436AD4